MRFLDFAGIAYEPMGFYEVTQQLGTVPEHVLQLLGADIRGLDPEPGSDWSLDIKRQGDSDYFYDEWGIGWRKPIDSELYFDMFDAPLKSAQGIDDVKQHKWPNVEDPARYAGIREEARNIEEASRAAIILGRMAAGTLELSAWTRGMENFYMDLAADPNFACGLMDVINELKMRYWELALAEVGDQVVAVTEADDMASQHSLIISPETYRRLIKPRHKRLFDHIHRLAPNASIFFHSCGAINELIPDLIEVGVDILNPVQVNAAGMDTKRLKKEFGDVLCFWGGGVDTQHILPYGTPQQVRDEVRRRIDDLAPGGGFIFNTVHNIQADVPPQNLAAMFETLREFGVYAGRSIETAEEQKDEVVAG